MKFFSKIIRRKLNGKGIQRRNRNHKTYRNIIYKKEEKLSFIEEKGVNEKTSEKRQNISKGVTNGMMEKENKIISIECEENSKKLGKYFLEPNKDRNIKKQNLTINYKKKFIFFNIKYILIIYLFLSSLSIKEKERDIFFQYSSIFLKVKVNGPSQIYHPSSNPCTDSRAPYPDKVYINEKLTYFENYEYIADLKTSDNITLVWINDISRTGCMFYGCNNISEINFSNFNTSNVKYMQEMFSSCTSLSSLNLSNFNTSKVLYMSYMFSYCINLISLNLANFLISNDTIVNYMFLGCSRLQHINLENSKIITDNYDNIFIDIPINLSICSNDDEWKKIAKNKKIPVKCLNNVQYSTELEIVTELSKYIKKSTIIILDQINEEILLKTKIEKYIQDLINKFNVSYNESMEDIEIQDGYLTFRFTSTEKQRNDDDKIETNINLSECEKRLKVEYNIPFNKSLFIILIEAKEMGMKIPKVEYEVYYPFYNRILQKLNLSKCEGSRIDISFHADLQDDLEKYNSSSDYYNNVCSKATSNHGTDINLKDRRNEFINKNLTLCEEDCKLIDYNNITRKAKCSCLVKIKLSFMEDIKFNKTKLFESFTKINNFANIGILKCYKSVIKWKNLKRNYSFFIYLCILIQFTVFSIIFFFKGYPSLIELLYQIIKAKRQIFEFKNKKEKKTQTSTGNNNIGNFGKRNKNNFNERIKRGRKRNKARKIKANKNSIKFPPKKEKNKTILNNNINTRDSHIKHHKKNSNISATTNQQFLNSMLNHNKKNNNKNNNNDDEILKYKKVLDYIDFEINFLAYNKAVISDKRTYIQYCLSLLRENHLLLFIFFKNDKDYNSQSIKIILFLFFFSVHFTVNAFFFNDSTMHKIYLDEGSFNFVYQISQIIYSSFISTFINKLVKFLGLSKKLKIKIKQEKNEVKFDEKAKKN